MDGDRAITGTRNYYFALRVLESGSTGDEIDRRWEEIHFNFRRMDRLILFGSRCILAGG